MSPASDRLHDSRRLSVLAAGFLHHAMEQHGSRTAVTVDLPVFVRTAEAALSLLGGSSTALVDRSVPVRLWLRPDDPLSHPLEATVRTSQSFLLRVVRRTPVHGRRGIVDDHGRHKADSHTAVSTSVVCRIEARHEFNALADFQYLPHGCPLKMTPALVSNLLKSLQQRDEETLKEQLPCTSYPAVAGTGAVEIEREGDGAVTGVAVSHPTASTAAVAAVLRESIQMVPATFSRIRHAQPYSYRLPCTSIVAPSTAHPNAAADFSIGRAIFTFVPGASVPRAPLPTPTITRQAAIERVLHAAFQLRPVWSPPALRMHVRHLMGTVKVAVWKFHLPAVAYRLNTGCFRSWVRLGYDPREDADSRIYQSLGMWVPIEFASLVSTQRGAGEGDSSDDDDGVATSKRCMAGIPIVLRPVFQLCDTFTLRVCDVMEAPQRAQTIVESSEEWLSAQQPADADAGGIVVVGSSTTHALSSECVADLLARLPRSEFFDGKAGWFTEAAMEQLRRAITLAVCWKLYQFASPAEQSMLKSAISKVRSQYRVSLLHGATGAAANPAEESLVAALDAEYVEEGSASI